MDTSKFLRNPIKDTIGVNTKDVQFNYSPDKKYQIVFSHFYEVRMGSFECLFTLLDDKENMIDNFEPLVSIKDVCWTKSSTFFAIAVRHFTYGYLIVELKELKIGFVKVRNPYPLDIFFHNNILVITYNDNQVALANSIQTFGGGVLEIPFKKMKKPKNIEISLEDITFYPRYELNNLAELVKSDPEYILELIDDGFNEFNGQFPEHTEQVYNKRQLSIYQLEAFAEYGDETSTKWLELIKQKTNNKYDKWAKVSDYIGFRKRN